MSHSCIFYALLAGGSVMAVGTAAQAQTADPLVPPMTAAPAPSPATDPTVAAAPVAAADPAPTSGDIIVTAQRRAQRLQDVPIAISVVSSDSLAKSNFTTVADLQYLSPGVNFNSNFGGGFNLRGVGTQSLLVTAEQSVGLVIDDVVQGLPEVSFAGPSYQSLGDIDRIEVLKGPQGTLFGKNSSAGVIQIITKKPVLNENTMDGTFSYGSRNEVNVDAAANVALGDNAAFRVDGIVQRRDGFVKNLYNGEDLWAYQRQGIRGKLLWKPTSTLNILLSADYRHAEDNANGQWTLRNCGSGFGTFKACTVDAPYGVVASPTNLNVAVDGDNHTRQNTYTFSGRIDYQIGNATLTSITAYRKLTQGISVDTDGSARPIYSKNVNYSGGSQFTQELRLNGKASIFDYTLGGFYYDARPFQTGINGGTLNLEPDTSTTLLSLTAIGPFASYGYPVDVESKVKSYAAFGQLEAKITNGLKLIGGLRYTHDDVSQAISYFDVGYVCRSAFALGGTCHTGPIPPVDHASTSAGKVTYKITAQYNFTPNINIYASYGTGYKGPLISYPANQPQQQVRPETSKSYEIGLKASLFNQRVVFNIDAFKVDYSDFQGQQRVGTPPTQYYTTTNAGGLQTKGIEADLSLRVTPNFTLAANGAYIPTKFTEFAVQCYDRYTNPATPVGQCTYLQPGQPSTAALQFNAAGYPLVYSPKYSFVVRGDYSLPVANDMTVDIHADYNWRSSVYGVVADPNSVVPSYGLVNAQLGFGAADGSWRVAVFARNLLDKYFVAGIFRTPLDAGTYGSTPLSTLGYSNIPALDSSRTIGGKLSVAFGH